jgi:hypothetical protein
MSKKRKKPVPHPAIEDVIAAIAAKVPKEEWDRLPPDLTDNLDHYIYGTPKRQDCGGGAQGGRRRRGKTK